MQNAKSCRLRELSHCTDLTTSTKEELRTIADTIDELYDALSEAKSCISVYGPDYMHGIHKKHYVKKISKLLSNENTNF